MNLICDVRAPGQQVTQLLKLSGFGDVYLLGFDGSPRVPGFAPQGCPSRVPAHRDQTLCTRHSNSFRGHRAYGLATLHLPWLHLNWTWTICWRQNFFLYFSGHKSQTIWRELSTGISAHKSHFYPNTNTWVSRQDIGKWISSLICSQCNHCISCRPKVPKPLKIPYI